MPVGEVFDDHGRAGHDGPSRRPTPTAPAAEVGRGCYVEGCDQPHNARGLCQLHYFRRWRIGDVGPVGPMIDQHPPPNPWSGRLVCRQCGSSEWTLPFDPTRRDTSWRCVACHIWAAGPLAPRVQLEREGAA